MDLLIFDQKMYCNVRFMVSISVELENFGKGPIQSSKYQTELISGIYNDTDFERVFCISTQNSTYKIIDYLTIDNNSGTKTIK